MDVDTGFEGGKNMNKTTHRIKDPYPQFCVICGRDNHHLLLSIEYNNEIWFTARFCSMRCFKKIKISFETIAKNKFTEIEGIVYAIRELKVDDEQIKWWLEGTVETISIKDFKKNKIESF